MNKTQLKKAEKNASEIVSSINQVIDEAFEAEIVYITGELRKNRPLTYTLAGVLKNDGLTALLDGRQQKESPATGQPRKGWKLRATCKRFKGLVDTKGAMEKVLVTLRPDMFTDESTLVMGADEKMNYLCMLLGVSRETYVPCKWFPELMDVEKFVEACAQRYNKCLKHLLGSKNLEDLKKGYYQVSSDGVTCLFDLPTPKIFHKFSDSATGRTEVVDAFDMESEIIVTGDMTFGNGRDMIFKELKQAFQDEGVEFPVAWGRLGHMSMPRYSIV